MAKKIRFSLEMEQGIMVGDVEALRRNFSLSQVLMYLSNGKLITWLRDRYEDDLADAVEGLEKDDPQLGKKISDIFEVEYDEKTLIDMEKAAERDAKLRLLKEHTTEQRFTDHVDQVAFTQDDLYDLLDADEKEIYLCGEQFTIPLAKKGIHYIGINRPVVVINAKTVVNWQDKEIQLTDVVYDEKYREIEQEESVLVEDDKLTQDGQVTQNEQINACQGLFLERSVEEESWDGVRHFMDEQPAIYRKVYLVQNVLAEKAVAVKKCNGKIYYIVKDEEGSGHLHIYDTLTYRDAILNGKIENIEWEPKGYNGILDCTEDWAVYKPRVSATDGMLYVFDVKNNQMKTISGIKHSLKYNLQAVIVNEYLYIAQDVVYKINLNTKYKSPVFSKDYTGTVFGRMMKDKDCVLFFYKCGTDAVRFYRIDCKTDKMLDRYKIEGLGTSVECWKSMLFYKDKVYYAEVKLPDKKKEFGEGLGTILAPSFRIAMRVTQPPEWHLCNAKINCFDIFSHENIVLNEFEWHFSPSDGADCKLNVENGNLRFEFTYGDVCVEKSIAID